MKKTHTFTGGVLTFVLLAGAPMVFAETSAGADASATTGSGSASVTAEGTVSPRDSASGMPAGKRQYSEGIILQNHKGEMRAKVIDTRKMASSTREQMGSKMMNSSTTRVQMKEEMKGDMKGRRDEIEQKRNEMKSGMQIHMSNMVQKQGERITKRFDAALERLTNIAGRIDSRITKLGEKGVNTVKAKADLAIAKTKIDTAKGKLDVAKIAIAGIVNDTGTVATSTPDSMMSGKLLLIKEQVRGVEEALKDAHKALVVATADLKGKSDGRDKKAEATTTAKITE